MREGAGSVGQEPIKVERKYGVATETYGDAGIWVRAEDGSQAFAPKGSTCCPIEPGDSVSWIPTYRSGVVGAEAADIRFEPTGKVEEAAPGSWVKVDVDVPPRAWLLTALCEIGRRLFGGLEAASVPDAPHGISQASARLEGVVDETGRFVKAYDGREYYLPYEKLVEGDVVTFVPVDPELGEIYPKATDVWRRGKEIAVPDPGPTVAGIVHTHEVQMSLDEFLRRTGMLPPRGCSGCAIEVTLDDEDEDPAERQAEIREEVVELLGESRVTANCRARACGLHLLGRISNEDMHTISEILDIADDVQAEELRELCAEYRALEDEQ
jgi:hypothetical protein